MVPFWIPMIIRHVISMVPKRDYSFDSHPYVYRFRVWGVHELRIFAFGALGGRRTIGRHDGLTHTTVWKRSPRQALAFWI